MCAVPAQRFDNELLDGPIDDWRELRTNLQEMALANRLTLSNRSVLRRIEQIVDVLPPDEPVTILDIATGAGGLPRAIERWARRKRRRIVLIASDVAREVVGVARGMLDGSAIKMVRHDALQMPFADRSIDIVTCAFSLHHFAREGVVTLLREMARVARRGAIVSDLRRSYGGYWGARLLALGPWSRLSRHDGPLSVLRAYTADEAQALIEAAGIPARARPEPASRLMLAWETRTLPVAA
jgi:SAM-dependent methyltransferase